VDRSESTDLARMNELRRLADEAMASTPAPADAPAADAPAADALGGDALGGDALGGDALGGDAQPAGESAASDPAAAALAEAARAQRDLSISTIRRTFEFQPQELARALGRAAGAEGKPPPNASPADVASFYKAGEEAGISRKGMESALHQVALERVQRGKPAAPAPRPGEEPPPADAARRRSAIAVMGVGAGLALLLGGVVMFMDEEEEPPAAAPATPEPAPAPAKPVEPDKPRRKPGQLDGKLLAPAIAATGERTKGCHEAARKAQPKLQGRIVFDVELEEDGRFSRLDIKEDTAGDATMLECVKAQVRAHDWPKPTGGFAAFEFALQFQVAEETRAKKAGKKRRKRK
jgi:hypothetical protein